MSPQERQPRVSTRLPVVETGDGRGVYYTKNLSMGGLFLLSDKRWAVGSVIELALSHGTTRLEFKARITHLQRDGVGLCFIDPSDDVREALRKIIASQIPQNRSGGLASALKNAVGLASAAGTRIAWSDGESRFESAARDLDARSAFFEFDAPPAVGSTIIVYLPATTQNDDEEIEHELRGCTAEVVGHSEGGFAVKFLTPSAEFRMAIERLLREPT
jgi:hypothetical protein